MRRHAAGIASALVALTVGGAVTSSAAAQSPYPAKPLTFVIPATPGGLTDQLGRVLAQKMPNPKAGTVGEDLQAIVKELMAGKFEFKNDKQGNVHSVIGKLSFGPAKLKENLEFFIKTIKDVKPTGVKGGTYVNTVFVCNAMGPGIRVGV